MVLKFQHISPVAADRGKGGGTSVVDAVGSIFIGDKLIPPVKSWHSCHFMQCIKPLRNWVDEPYPIIYEKHGSFDSTGAGSINATKQ